MNGQPPSTLLRASFLFLVPAALSACGDPSVPGPSRCSAAAVACQDQSIQQLRLYAQVNEAATVVEEGVTSGDFTTYIDARAGGATPNTSYVYVRFTQTGLEKVLISDEEALESLEWDLAVRRFIVRLNSGVSGPACTEAARLPSGTAYDGLMQVPSNLTWNTEAYFNDGCELVTDESGIGAPGTALATFWTYSSCVQMSGEVFVLHLRDGRYVKLQVLSYYDPAPQAECDLTGTVPVPSGSGNVRIRWAFVRAP